MTEQDGARLREARVWVEDWLLGDVRTFLLGMHVAREGAVAQYRGAPVGAGNLSVPILLSTDTELLAALHAGCTDYGPQGCNATANVLTFVRTYWPNPYHCIAELLWDGMRNGLTHTFAAKWFTSDGAEVDIQFSVGDESRVYSSRPNHGAVVVSVYELYEIVRDSATEYFNALRTDSDLLGRCRTAFDEFMSYRRDITKDTKKSAGARWVLAQCPPGTELALLSGRRQATATSPTAAAAPLEPRPETGDCGACDVVEGRRVV